ncbi:MAG: HD domain-containing protein, partial [Bacteroidales bacterium]|nr:HD domain-containing protein [Bacteroidales bacterium]
KELGYTAEEFLAMNIWDFFPEQHVTEYRLSLTRILEGQTLGKEAEFAILGKNGKTHYIEVLSAPHFSGKDMIGFQGIARDITNSKRGKELIRKQLEHLTSMRGIDQMIASNFDLKISLAEILKHLTIQLGADAADIMILNPYLQILDLSAKRGFRNHTLQKGQIRLGESFAGRVALDHKMLMIQNRKTEPANFLLASLYEGEDFVSYIGIPLIAKGQVKGVLEVFHRTVLDPDEEWFDFLNTLAGQAAIAIEVASLFENLQRSNSEIIQAYDATIEGWSRALDLRDKETEGHTLRVAEMAVNLARIFGLSEAELVQVRWGSLLHDIGKMGVPDGILNKPAKLTDEEWVVMKKHPTFAHEMISPIRYLRLALDIPYCHHEKWDGTGYPQGLKGIRIPLVARIFSAVDVWDALLSDRPYRAAWTEEKAREYIHGSSGTHFDPQVVIEFLKMQNHH